MKKLNLLSEINIADLLPFFPPTVIVALISGFVMWKIAKGDRKASGQDNLILRLENHMNKMDVRIKDLEKDFKKIKKQNSVFEGYIITLRNFITYTLGHNPPPYPKGYFDIEEIDEKDDSKED